MGREPCASCVPCAPAERSAATRVVCGLGGVGKGRSAAACTLRGERQRGVKSSAAEGETYLAVWRTEASHTHFACIFFFDKKGEVPTTIPYLGVFPEVQR